MAIICENISIDRVGAIDIKMEINRWIDHRVECYRLSYGGGQRGDLAYWPDSGRAAVCLGGDSIWLDADSPQDALRQATGDSEA